MTDTEPITAAEIDTSKLLLIVVGAHLRAEIADRPLAVTLQKRIRRWLQQHATELNGPFLPVVCCDIWYVNHRPLRQRPTISLGGPGVNALSAFYQKRLPTALVQDEKLMIQLDPEYIDLRVCVWGGDHESTVVARDLFVDRYLERYLRAVANQVEPQVE